MLFRIFFASAVLLFLPSANAQDANTPASSTLLDIIEMLGEIDDADSESLDAAISQVEVKNSQTKTYPQEVKK
jgi:hypothetical protein